MPITTLSLTRASIVWRPGHATRTRGYGVLSAVAYDGTRGILPMAALPPIHFNRRPRRGYDLIAPSTSSVGDDGALIATFEDTPKAIGWAITLTLTRNLEDAKTVVDSTLAAVGSALDIVPGLPIGKAVLAAATTVSEAIVALTGPRIVGTWINSELDEDDLGHDWRISHESFKARFELEYDVDDGRGREDD
jgi:hypothetical protein